MVQITTKFKYKGLIATMRKYPQMLKKESEQILRTEGRSLAKELARQTLPLGLGEAAWKKLAFKISGDVRRAIISPAKLFHLLETAVSRSFAKEVWALMHSGDKKRNRTLGHLIASAPLVGGLPINGKMQSEWVRRLRTGEYGGVPKGFNPSGIVTEEAAIKNFITRMQRNIGMAKAGWAAAGRSISGRNVDGIPQWASYGRHKVGGQGIYIKEKNKIRLINEVKHSRKALPANLEARAKSQAARNLELYLLHAANALCKKAFARSPATD